MPQPLHRRQATALLSVLLALPGCGGSDETQAEKPAPGHSQMNGYRVPARTVPDPTLPDSCEILTAAEPGPKELIAEPLAPVERISNVCIVRSDSEPGYSHSIAVELRHPEQLEIEAGVPTSLETFWRAEGGGIDLLGGRREQIQEIDGLGDFATWYPIHLGLGLHAYLQGRYIVRITIRGIELERGLVWARTVAQRALEESALLAQAGSAPVQ